MIKKRRKYGGVLAVGLSLALSLSIVSPVFATSPETLDGVETSDDDVLIKANSSNSDTTRSEGEATLDDEVDSENVVLVDVNIPTSFTVKIPKKTELTASSGISSQKYEAGTLSCNIPVYLKCNLGAEQSLYVDVPTTFTVAIRNGKDGRATRSMKCELNNSDVPSDNTENKYTNNSNKVTISAKNDKVGGAIIDDNFAKVASYDISNTDPIWAGHWAAALAFTVHISDEHDYNFE